MEVPFVEVQLCMYVCHIVWSIFFRAQKEKRLNSSFHSRQAAVKLYLHGTVACNLPSRKLYMYLSKMTGQYYFSPVLKTYFCAFQAFL